MRKLSLILVLIFLICCGPKLYQGKIIAKRFEPKHTTIEWVKVGETTYPITITIPDRWFITIGALVIGSSGKEKWKERTFQVDEKTFNQFHVGDTYPPAERNR